ncbi:ABC-type sugar transport system, substrate-binding protein, contains N-terminal xre family HTH domain [Sporobacter termitidis DSM 10068]|uniref:ABC-type sugar transport system, substrate-binding protein, contains N-terminal xre family HTH domain n=1 Tax=Sporobacter termitidis DSM 10068 TaxID=1123282 RepID=A0A1M5YG56_9FIRM|nr:substrate-binding domain-containing protein [Sporobacter termitidis]SHI10874.1 ABC-type sugar transport system, substrate-binding protein, contains N-terminal xre family HTH domain [Sporobacter termitidis DSM 10068]
MKKAAAILVAVLLALSLAACGSSPGTTNASPSGAPAAPSPGAGASPSAADASPQISEPAWEPGFYDPEMDYSKNPRYKVAYMTQQTSLLFDSFSKAFQKWADKENVEYSFWCANGDNDLYITTIQTYADQGYDGFLTDPDITIYPRIGDLMNDIKLPWMPVMGPPRDADGKLIQPSVGFDFQDDGRIMAQWLIDYQKKTWPDAQPAEIGFLALDMSTSPPLHVRVAGEKEVWDKAFPGNEKNFFISDAASQSSAALNADTGYNITGPVITAHPDIKYWLVGALLDDFAMGGARAFEAAGKQDNAVEIVMGGDGLITQWDEGQDSCWKAALYTAETVYAEPIFNGLYAMLSGQATPETLWPAWINHSAGEKYASLMLPSEIITKENYQSFMAYCDLYTGIKMTDYTWDGTSYPMRLEVPAAYSAPAA